MPILNYTTKIDVYKTLGEIQGILVKHGARKVLQEYDAKGNIMGLSFMVEVAGKMLPIQLPANVDRILVVLQRQKVKCDREQAERIAWRIIKDWIAAQMAILETEMVTLDEVFLPYMLQNDGKTLYQAFQESQYKLTGGDGIGQ
ncbi:MAG: hypothetical protein PHY64_00340 [Eubacteriales bacterium]|nr:hypothetical protein [Eubacteriales bacterium]